MTDSTIENGTDIDSRIKAEYQYTHTQQPEKRLDALIRFLVEQQRLQKGKGDSR